jgi:hypothetical protein
MTYGASLQEALDKKKRLQEEKKQRYNQRQEEVCIPYAIVLACNADSAAATQ